MSATAARKMSTEYPLMPNLVNFKLKHSKAPPTVLIADSDASNLRLVSNIIEDEGFRVIVARDGREAREALQYGGHITAAVLEGLLPDVSGPAIVRYMKSDESLKDIPVMMMTRASSARLSCEAFAAGAAVLVPEPFSITQLQNLLHTLVDGSRDAESISH